MNIPIQIDHKPLKAPRSPMTGAEIRALAEPPVGSDRDLFLTNPGPKDDLKIGDDEAIEIKPGSHFYTGPRHIDPGAHRAGMEGGPCS